MSNRTWIQLLGIALSSALVLTAAALAQEQRHPREGGPRGESTGAMGAFGPMRFLRELNLSDGQRQQIRSLLEEVEATGVPTRLHQARESLQDAIESGADEGTLRQQASQLGEVEGDAAVEWAQASARIQEILTPEQRAELAQLKKQGKERMELMRKQREERRARQSKPSGDPL